LGYDAINIITGYNVNNGIITKNGNDVKDLTMPSLKTNLLIHPIRLQIVTALSNRQMTARELADFITRVPLTTLYRHINALVDGGLLQIASETQVRGTVERTYALAVRPSISADDLRGMKKQDYQQAFMIYLSSLMSIAQRYLDRKGDDEEFNPLDDGMELSLGTLNLSDEEFQDLNRRILDVILSSADNPPGAGRKPRTFTYLFIPE
jgi:DNA-binding transcriptional ArsR family regulator